MLDGLADFHISVSIFIGIGPALMVLFCSKGEEPWTWGALLTGCILVLIATLHLAVMTDLKEVFPVFAEKGHLTEAEAATAVDEIKLWVLMFPAVVGAIGANYISAWFQSSRPKKADR